MSIEKRGNAVAVMYPICDKLVIFYEYVFKIQGD